MSESDRVSGEISSGHAMDIFISGIERTARSQRVFAHEGGSHKSLEQIYKNLESSYQRLFLDQTEPLDVEVRPTQMICERRVVYENADLRTSLSRLLHSHGIRLFTIRPGASLNELLELIAVFAADYTKPENMDSDLYSSFKERSFEHFEVVSEDLIQESFVRDPDLKERMTQFQHWLQRKSAPKVPADARRLRADDLKVLEEFQIKSSAFAKPDEEVSQIVRNMTRAAHGNDPERETLERLALMGFHFLLQEGDPSQIQVGRDLLIQLGKMMLQQSYVELFAAALRKVQDIHRDRSSLRGELQKILDSWFQAEHYPLFSKLLQQKETRPKSLQCLLGGPPTVAKLMVLLLGDDPTLHKDFAPMILKYLPEFSNWLLEEVQRFPNREAWEQLVNLLGSRPNAHFSKFLQQLLESAGPAVRTKVLRQCAVLGTAESLQVFKKLLESSKAEDRLEAYEYLPLARNKLALNLVKIRLESPEFESWDESEKESAYLCLLRMGGDAAWPWFESQWEIPGTGIFKSRTQNQRRLQLAKAAIKARLDHFLLRMHQKGQELSQELHQLLSEIQKRGGQS